MRNFMKQNKAITLIALVITIIVLLILAGVTIATLTGDNGLLTKASDAQKESLKAEGLEKLQVEIAGSYDNNGKIDTNQLRKNLQNIAGITTENDEPITNNTEVVLPMLVKINGNQYLINLNGTTRAKYGIDEYDIAAHPETYYGSYVTNYNSPNDAGIVDAENQLGKWQIFMADDDNVFLIASNCITAKYIGKKNNKTFGYDSDTATNISFSNDILDQYNANSTSTDIPEILSRLDKQSIYHKYMNTSANQIRNNNNEKAVASMLDVDVWSGYNNPTYAKYAIGGPTIEMFCKSYNDTRTEGNPILEAKEDDGWLKKGYKVQKGTASQSDSTSGLETIVNSLYYKSYTYWLASPSAYPYDSCIMTITLWGGSIGYQGLGYPLCFRPLVCLNSNVHLVKNADGETYSLELN